MIGGVLLLPALGIYECSLASILITSALSTQHSALGCGTLAGRSRAVRSVRE
jgi:hypothetical protein